MLYRIVRVAAHPDHPDHTVELLFDEGEAAIFDHSALVASGPMTAPLPADPGAFVSGLRIGQDGDAIGGLGEIEIDADALWYTAWKTGCGRRGASPCFVPETMGLEQQPLFP